MQLSHTVSNVSVAFDDPNLVACAGLAPVMELAGRAGLPDLVAGKVKLGVPGGVFPGVKVPALVAGMIAGADSIDDLELLRHGGMDRLFTGIHAPSTYGTFLRSFTFGHVRQLDSVAAAFLVNLTSCAPLLPGADQLAYVDLDDTVKATYGYAKQGAGYGYSGVKGLNALIAAVSTSQGAPLIVAARLRRGQTNSARGVGSLATEGLATARRAGATGRLILRADSAFYGHKICRAAHRAGAHFSLTARMDAAVTRAIAGIDADAWTPIRYPRAIWEAAEDRWISDAEVAEVRFTAFTSTAHPVTARLIVRRVKRLQPGTVVPGQGELFADYRHHAIFTDSPYIMLQAEADHRRHAIVEQVFADLKDSALAHLPSGKFAANAAWLVLATMAFNLTRAAGALASLIHAKARTGTIRAQLINIPARLARTGRRLTLHLPKHWPWQDHWQELFTAISRPPPTP